MSDKKTVEIEILDSQEPEDAHLLTLVKGPEGKPGVQGVQGPAGPQGVPGLTGKQGIPGPIGPQGVAGAQGIRGIDGKDGADGKDGPTGPQGPSGADGNPGPKGEKGDKGDKGDPGPEVPRETIKKEIGNQLKDIKIPMYPGGGGGGFNTPFIPASAGSGGQIGLVPAPSAGDQNKVLHGDGTWQPDATGSVPTGTGVPHIVGGVQNAAASLIVAADITNATITDVQVAAANKDGAAGTASMRTLGTGAAQAFPGNSTIGLIASGTYAARPAAATSGANAYYFATDIGVNGCLFRSALSIWQQVGAIIYKNTTNRTITTTAETSVFDFTPTLPDGCLAAGTFMEWGWESIGTGAGAYADPNTKVKMGSTLLASTGVLPASLYQGANRRNWAKGSLTVRTVGSPGTVMAEGVYQMEFGINPSSMYPNFITKDPTTLSDVAATNVNNATACTPDVTLTIANFINTPTANIKSAWLRISGLV